MDPALYYGIYRERIDEQVILRHTEHVKTRHLHYSTENHVWRAQP